MNRVLALCLSCMLFAACKADENVPYGSAPSGPSTGGDYDAYVPSSGDDAGSTDDEDGGAIATASECDKVNPAEAANEDLDVSKRPSRITLPTDFVVTRTVTTWAGRCPDATLVIKMSDGICPAGAGHEIALYLSAKAITGGMLLLGDNAIEPEAVTGTASIRYTRPKTLDTHGVWGTCKGATGNLRLPDGLNLDSHDNLLGSFELTLTDCSGGDTALPPEQISGAFNVRLHRTLGEYCHPGE